MPDPRPRLLASSVVRGARQGQSHGGLCIVDFETGSVEFVLDWNTTCIDVDGRGGDRGLRGIGIEDDRIFVLSTDALLEFDPAFELVGTFRNPYLKHCHELSIHRGLAYLVSTGFDSVLVFDLARRAFVSGVHLAFEQGMARALLFDPITRAGPGPVNRFHLNSVTCIDEGLFFSGLRSGGLLRMANGKLSRRAPLPAGTHNAQPFADGVIYNDTAKDRVCASVGRRDVAISVPVEAHPGAAALEGGGAVLARPFFARGLCPISPRFVAGGSSPSTVTLYDLENEAAIAQAVISRDVRNAVHGLALWPF